MSKHIPTPTSLSPNVIEILDSSDTDSEIETATTSNNNSKNQTQIPANDEIPAPVSIPSTATTENEDNADNDDDTTFESSTSNRILTRRQLLEQLPVALRTKNASKNGISRMRLLSMDYTDGKRQGLSSRSQENMSKINRFDSKKKNSLKEEINEVVEAEMKNPEMIKLLRKIAYCRVFTNYLFRQYDMLSIDFELYSNYDDLMLNLKRRVGAYNAIRRSRLQILLGNSTREGSGSASTGAASRSSREGSTA